MSVPPRQDGRRHQAGAVPSGGSHSDSASNASGKSAPVGPPSTRLTPQELAAAAAAFDRGQRLAFMSAASIAQAAQAADVAMDAAQRVQNAEQRAAAEHAAAQRQRLIASEQEWRSRVLLQQRDQAAAQCQANHDAAAAMFHRAQHEAISANAMAAQSCSA